MEGENKEGFSSQGTKVERLASVPFRLKGELVAVQGFGRTLALEGPNMTEAPFPGASLKALLWTWSIREHS